MSFMGIYVYGVWRESISVAFKELNIIFLSIYLYLYLFQDEKNSRVLPEPPRDGIYGFMKQAGKRMRKHWSLGKSLRRISKISVGTSPTLQSSYDQGKDHLIFLEIVQTLSYDRCISKQDVIQLIKLKLIGKVKKRCALNYMTKGVDPVVVLRDCHTYANYKCAHEDRNRANENCINTFELLRINLFNIKNKS